MNPRNGPTGSAVVAQLTLEGALPLINMNAQGQQLTGEDWQAEGGLTWGPGSAASGSGATACDQCAAGTFSSAAASECAACGAGQISSAGAASCDDCPAGKIWYDTQPVSSCESCEMGTYSARGTESCSACAVGKYDGDEDAATLCEDCPSSFTSDEGSVSCKPACSDEQIHDCNQLCVDASWKGDSFCDDPYEGHTLNCAELEFDGGDCEGDSADFVLDCLNQRAPASWSGDGTCDNGIFQHNGYWVNLNCETTDWDGGDCNQVELT